MKKTEIQKSVTILAILCFVQSILFIPNINAQSRELVQEENNQKRIALVIGNGNYTSARKLENPVNDANDMTRTLEDLGFEVISGTDLTRRQMNVKVREFGDRLRATKGVGLFYYAGHGVQVKNKNYLIPVNAEIPREDEVDFAAFDLNIVMRKMATANNGLNIVILDACRDNPFARGWSRSVEDGGLAQVTAPTGTFIAYATAPNRTASDGTGRNGLYTAELLKYLKKPGLKIEETFKQVTIAVDASSEGKQIPWTSSSLRGDFYFNAEGKQPSVKIPVKSTSAKKQGKPTASEQASWDLVKDSKDASDFEFYLKEFPSGVFSASARLKIRQIEKETWDLIKESGDSNKIKKFLDQFPQSENAPVARIILKNLSDDKKQGNITPKSGEIKRNSIGMEFVWISPGEFMMGANESEKGSRKNERPQRKIVIKDGFWIGKYEITQRQYEQIIGENPGQYYKNCGSRCPAEGVSWKDAKAFINKLNARNDGMIYSLPSEAQWEYAARAGTSTRYSFGDDKKELKNYGRHGKGSGPHVVGELLPNKWGLFDMHGNVWEWCEDYYSDNYQNSPTDGSPNLSSEASKKRVVRGGSFIDGSGLLRSAYRHGVSPKSRLNQIGFRVVARVE